MYKILALLGIPAVVLFLVVWKNELDSLSVNQEEAKQPFMSTPINPETLGVSTTAKDPLIGWEKKAFNNLGFSISYPADITINERGASVEIEGGGLSITINKQFLSEKETVNTQAEKDIDAKMLEQKDAFELLEPIEPIAIGSVTGIAFTTLEKGAEITYFYVPGDKDYLVIQNKTGPQNPDSLTVSDKIIYSLEFLSGF